MLAEHFEPARAKTTGGFGLREGSGSQQMFRCLREQVRLGFGPIRAQARTDQPFPVAFAILPIP
jgi:hypothetical protein